MINDIINLIVILLAIYGWYIFINDLINTQIYQKIKFNQNIKIKVIVKDQEENIEVFVKKLQKNFEEIKDIEIIDDNSKDKTYEILQKIQTKEPNIKVKKELL